MASNKSKNSGEENFFQIMIVTPPEWDTELRLIRYQIGNIKDCIKLVQDLLQYETELIRK